jgi:chromatin segregation and condensation protein Rec8/ScpA/Scc1 (kleisin family)
VGEALLSDLFVDLPSRPRRVFTFLGVLEMARHQMLDVLQESHLGAIRLCPRVSAEDADYSRFAQDDEEPPDAEGDA